MKISTLFFVILASGCALATVHYDYPELPCSWSFTVNMRPLDESSSWFDAFYYANGHHFKKEEEDHVNGQIFSYANLLRADLGNETGYIKSFTWTEGTKYAEENVRFEDVKDEFRLHYPGREIVGDFDSVEDDTFDGRKCKKYHRSDVNYSLYVDEEGWPFHAIFDSAKGLSVYKESYNFTFIKGASLSEFYANSSIPFEDTRAFTAPNDTLCHNESSSESSESETSSKSSETSSKSSETSSKSSETSSKSSETSSKSKSTSSSGASNLAVSCFLFLFALFSVLF